MKKWYIIGSLLLLAVVCTVVVWLKMNKRYDDNNPLLLIPQSSVAVVKVNGADRYLNTTADLAQSHRLTFTHFSAVVDSTLNELLSYIDTASAQEPISQRTLYISLHASERDTAEVLMVSIPLNSYMDGLDIFSKLKATEGIEVADTTFNGCDLNIIRRAGQVVYSAIVDGCIFVSDQVSVVAHTASRSEAPLHDDDCFSTLERTSSPSAQASLFVNVGALDSVRLGYLPPMSGKAKWMELDIDFAANAISSNGFLTTEYYSIVSALADHKPSPFDVDDIIPSYAKMFICFSPSQRGLSDDSYVKYLTARGQADDYRSRASFNVDGINIEEQLSQALSGSVTLFSSSASLTDTANTCLVVGAPNGTIAQGALNSAISALRKHDPKEVEVLAPIPSLAVPVYEALTDDANVFFLADMLPYVPRRYFLRYENTLMIADNIATLKRTLYETLLNRTFANDASFRAFRQPFSSDFTFFAFCNGQTMGEVIGEEEAGNFYGFGFQMSSLSGLPYVNVSCNFDAHRGEMQPTAWQTKLDAPLIGQPYIVTNHNTRELECIVQDANNKIYLVNPQGLVLWSRKVDGPIVGRVQQIDYYCNKKLQYLFATKESVHLIDRNGNNTAKFPIHLPCEAVGGVTYIDYGNPREFRLFVPCSDKRTLLYDKNCKFVEGWEMKHTEGEVRSEIDHWVSGNKDYLVSHDDFRIYITDRRGNERVSVKPIAPNANSRIYMARVNTPNAAFIIATADGKMATVRTDDGSITMKQIDYMGANPYYMFKLHGREQFVFVDKEHIVLTDDKGSRLNVESHKLSDDIRVSITADNNLVIWDKGEKLGYIKDTAGKTLEGFPIPAHSMMTVSRADHNLNVVTAGADFMLNNYIK